MLGGGGGGGGGGAACGGGAAGGGGGGGGVTSPCLETEVWISTWPVSPTLCPNPPPTCATAGTATIASIASVTANRINFLNFFYLLKREYSRLRPLFFHRQLSPSMAKRKFFSIFLKVS
jgi:hypothetical protein